MAKNEFKGFKQIDGTVSGFTTESLEDGYVYFVRTSSNGEEGFVYLNGKKYGEVPDIINCGTY